MPLFDMPVEELRVYRPAREEPADFDAFWSRSLGEARSHDLAADFAPVDFGLSTVDVFDVSFCGFNGDRIKAWYILPRSAQGPLPGIVEYIGYGGGRGYPHGMAGLPLSGLRVPGDGYARARQRWGSR